MQTDKSKCEVCLVNCKIFNGRANVGFEWEKMEGHIFSYKGKDKCTITNQ